MSVGKIRSGHFGDITSVVSTTFLRVGGKVLWDINISFGGQEASYVW